MSYTKLDSSGSTLPDSATSWSMVKDNVTGLIWEVKTNSDGKTNYGDPHDADNTYTWYDSNSATNGGNAGTYNSGQNTEAFIKQLNDAHYGGYSDWRMPTIKELSYLVNYGSTNPSINTNYFPNIQLFWYNTSTTYSPETIFAWGVDFKYGDSIASYGKQSPTYALAVRGELPKSFYIDNGNGTVTDTVTGLMWQQGTGEGQLDVKQALSYCENLNLGGYTDWRLPNIKELHSLIDYSRFYPSINTTYFLNPVRGGTGYYWSSTKWFSTKTWGTDLWVGVVFTSGYDSHFHASDVGYVRAVRGGQSGSLGDLVISASAGNGGSIDPSGSVSVNSGGSQTFTITPNTGYVITDVMVDGVSVSAVSTYTFKNVSVNHTISASFSSSCQPDIRANGQSGSISVSSTTSVSITASLTPGTESGNSADWWLFCNTSGTWYSFIIGGWAPGVSSIFQAPLMAVSPVVIYNGYLPVGDYAFYFAVDLTPDGALDAPLHHSEVQVHVTQ